MIRHHSQAITMSHMVRNQASSPHVKDLAARIEAGQGPEIQQMSELLTVWGALSQPAPALRGMVSCPGW